MAGGKGNNIRVSGNGIAFIIIYGAIVIIAIMIFVFLSKSLGDYRIYKSHSWVETEARFVNAEEYQKTVRRRSYTGTNRYRVSQETRYRWRYSYEVNGSRYSYITDGHQEGQPNKPTRGILVAADNASVYLQYGSEGALKFVQVFSWGITIVGGLIIVGLIFLLRYLQKKKKME